LILFVDRVKILMSKASGSQRNFLMVLRAMEFQITRWN